MLIYQDLLPLNQYIRSSIKKYLANFEAIEFKKITDLYKLVLSEVEKPLIEISLEYTNGNQSKAAKLLGLSRNTLRKLINDYQIDQQIEKSIKNI